MAEVGGQVKRKLVHGLEDEKGNVTTWVRRNRKEGGNDILPTCTTESGTAGTMQIDFPRKG